MSLRLPPSPHNHKEKNLEQLLTAPELAELLGLHPKTIYDLALRKVIPAFKIGSALRFRASEVEAWLVSRRA